jgi:hypothetical protein
LEEDMHRAPRTWLAVAAVIAATTPAGHAAADSGAEITASFADACRDVAVHASKDISHVVIRYADGRVVKDETINHPDYSRDGGPGDEVTSVSVKSSTTVETFECRSMGSPPAALLEWRICQLGIACRDWTAIDSDGNVGFIGHYQNPVPLRGVNSGDADGDLVSWSMSFGDGSPPVNGDWASAPSAEVEHLFPLGCWNVTLTVTDATGLTGTDLLVVCVIDQNPD